ncbi:MAG TPA: amino acid adenylation domain-containing protein, partial [Herpetosiphonaceae bacterium]
MITDHIADLYSLSPMQRGMLFHTLYAPSSGVYFQQISCAIRGAFQVPAFAQAWEHVLQRHPILRSAMLWEDLDEPLQAVLEEIDLPLEELDWRGLAPAEQQAQLDRFLADDIARGFDLSAAPLLRLTLIRLDEQRYQFVWDYHHMLIDAWSMALILDEVFTSYAAFTHGEQPELPRSRPYRDYIAWLQRQDQQQAEDFWRRSLAGITAPTAFGVDRPLEQAADQPEAYADRQIELDETLTAALQTLAQQYGLTLNTLIQGAWALLLSYYSGAHDVVFGVTVSGRSPSLAGVETMVGLFINTLPLRVQLAHEQPLMEWLQQVLAQQVEVLQYEYSSLTDIQGWSSVPRNLPLFESIVFFENFPVSSALQSQNDRLGFELEDPRGFEQTNYPLIVVATPRTTLSIRISYDCRRFADDTIERMLGHLATLLQTFIADPAQRLADLSPLTGTEQQLLQDWNATGRDVPFDRTFQQLFEAQTARTPDAVAALYADLRITYAELNRRANQLAHLLIEQGVGPETVVALLANRGVEFLTAVLAIFKAGGAYLPLDPHHPVQRHQQVLSQSQATIALATGEFQPVLQQALLSLARRPRLFQIDSPELEQRSPENPPVRSGPSNLAYVIYTSGSTGQPKGAMVEQRGMINHLYAKIHDLGLTAADTVAETASQCFDISVWQFLVALVVGGRVRVYDDEIAHDPQRLLAHTAGDGISILETVPSLMRMMLDTIEGAGRPDLRALRWMIPTGEALPAELARQWLTTYPQIPLVNAYGPTECSDDVTHYPMYAPPAADVIYIPIGQPVVNMRLYILDTLLRPVPINTVGELYVGGIGVGRGYLNDGQRTATAFIPDPFSTAPGARLYKTGDLARYQPDGNIVFLGRIDHQVKIRGFRIELGEIEAVLNQYAGVRESAVLVQEDSNHNQQLVAYVVEQSQQAGAAESEVSDWDSEKVTYWRQIFDEVYKEDALSEQDSQVNLRVWVSSYTGQQMPEPDIFECIDDSVERILALQPKRVLELGCGTGLMLFRVAPHCEYYCGTDLSPAVVELLDAQVQRRRDQLPPIELLARAADELDGIPEAAFDVVILNEVVQYFPSVNYLARVLERAITRVKPGGTLFVGGLRSYPLLEAFHTSVQLYQAPDALSLPELRQRIQKHLGQEKELAVEPTFFNELQRYLPQISDVQIQLKGGRAENELTKFRYDVVIRVGAAAEVSGTTQKLDWQTERLTVAAVREMLVEHTPDQLRLVGVPNARVLAELAAVDLLANPSALTTAVDLKQAIQDAAAAGVQPADLWDLSRELPYSVNIAWSTTGKKDAYDVVLTRRAVEQLVPVEARTEHATTRPIWTQYANNPLQGAAASKFIPQLRSYLSQKLPEYMVPGVFVMLDALPLTANGKVDRKSLPGLEHGQGEQQSIFLAPRTPVEEMIAGVWADVLGLQQVGVHDNFFSLGGHSLLATQVISRIREALDVELPLRSLFEAPTVAEFAATIEQSRQESQVVAVPPLVPVSRDQALPLSFTQERLWFLDQLDPGNPTYNIFGAVRLLGPLNVTALEQSLATVVGRHEILRTTFGVVAEQPVQVIAPVATIDLPLVDLRELPTAEREAEMLRLAGEEARHSFDLARELLLRTRLLRMDETEHVLFVNMHHIISDAWSHAVFIRELTTLYDAFAHGTPAALPELPIQYADYSVWQRQWLESGGLDELLDYWKPQLAGAPARLQLPTDHPRPAVQTFRGSYQSFELPIELARQLRDLSQKESATLFMTLLAAFNILLYRATEQDDIVIGTDIANRNRIETEALIGFFVNLLAIRTRLGGNPTFQSLLRQVRETTLGAFAHQDLPFAKLVDALRLQRSMDHAPL